MIDLRDRRSKLHSLRNKLRDEEFEHEWYDWSYHGSPMWKCANCGLEGWGVSAEERGKPCPEAERLIRLKIEKIEEEERRNHQRLKRHEEYCAYLVAKYGSLQP